MNYVSTLRILLGIVFLWLNSHYLIYYQEKSVFCLQHTPVKIAKLAKANCKCIMNVCILHMCNTYACVSVCILLYFIHI